VGEVIIIGVELAKNVFQVHRAAADGSVLFRKKLSRPQFARFMAQQPRCLLAMEACASAHHWAREMARHGHEVRLIAPRYAKPLMKRQKNDAADALLWDSGVVNGLRAREGCLADLKAQGVTIILTTHYIEGAEAIADRVGVINKGEILLVEDKVGLMTRMGQKQLQVDLAGPLTAVPEALRGYALKLGPGGRSLTYTYDTKGERTGIVTLLGEMRAAGLQITDLATRQSSLEDIFVGLVRGQA